MKIYRHLNEFKKRDSVVTIGSFDGVHIGHRKILSSLQEVKQQHCGESVILTFFPHPKMILHPEDVDLKLITTIDEKAELLEQLGVDNLIITPFTRDFSNLTAEEYIRHILVEQIGTQRIVIGYDHRFGKNREGGLKELQKYSLQYNYEVEEIAEQDINEIAVSSTRVRSALLNGDVKTAATLLNYPFHLTGKVIKGDQIGRRLGFPTANILVAETYKLIPADGIYAVTVEINEQVYKGMGYIGHRPTINGMSRNIEVNIFDFEGDLYGMNIRVHFYDFIRGDIRFNSLDELREQLQRDKEISVGLLRVITKL